MLCLAATRLAVRLVAAGNLAATPAVAQHSFTLDQILSAAFPSSLTGGRRR